MNLYTVMQILKEDEGFRSRMYLDTRGVPTIGYGFNLQKGEMPEEIAAQLLADRVNYLALRCPANFSFWYSLPEQAQEVLMCLAFNMGMRELLRFDKMLAHLEKGEFTGAADELRQSLWFHQVQPHRSERMVQMLRDCDSGS